MSDIATSMRCCTLNPEMLSFVGHHRLCWVLLDMDRLQKMQQYMAFTWFLQFDFITKYAIFALLCKTLYYYVQVYAIL